MSVYRYSEWDGSQDLPDLDADELIDELGHNLMSYGDFSHALRMMQNSGIRDSQGRRLPSVQNLLQRLRQKRQSQLDKYNLGSMMDEIRQKLDNILKTEQQGIQRRLDEARQKAGEGAGELSPEMRERLLKTIEDMAARNLKKLDELPPDVGGKIKELTDYDFMDEEARRQFQELTDMLKRHAMESYARDLMQKFKDMDASSLADVGHLVEALNQMLEMLQKMDRLEAQLKDSQYSRSLDVVDGKLLRELMGDDAAENLERLRSISQKLEEAGYIRLEKGKYQLTPRGMRKIGQKALQDVFAQLRKDRFGRHNINLRGTGGERVEETKKYEFGDDFHLHLQKTIMNSLYREPVTLPVKLSAEDFEVFQTEGLTRSATVLMLDLSLSMPRRGNFQAAKRVTVALDSLIRSQFPKDSLYIVGFSTYARQIKKEDIAYINWDDLDSYTNMQHGLYLARKLLAKDRATNKQIVLISDGEPTAHFEGGNIFFQYPPSLRTLQLTLREVKNCTQKGIVINAFILESGRSLHAFVTEMARINKGRVFFTSADTLGQYLLVDYVSGKRRSIQ